MDRRQFIAQSFTIFLAAMLAPSRLLSAAPPKTFRLAFGSCADQELAQPVWQKITEASPDLFAFLGDNIYADTNDMLEMAARYNQLSRNPQFTAFREKFPIVATWDDHDYGMNDAGAEYSHKEESKKQFLDFFGEPADSKRRHQNGIYTSYTYGEAGRRVQLILLDLRWFRTALERAEDGAYVPNPDPSAVLLGEDQWQWLAAELKKPADFRILASSVQLVSSEHRWEKWANFPHEKARLYRLIDSLAVKNLLVISGDMHFGELSRERTPAGTVIHDFTSSGLNYAEPADGGNGKRVALFDSAPNFGLVTVNWDASPPEVSLELRDENGQAQIRKKFTLPAR